MATSVTPPRFADLVNDSDCIVSAVVKRVTAVHERPGSRRIITRVELDVREVIAGRPAQPLVLVMLGGKVGDQEMILEGMPQFHAGDEGIFFVQGNGRQVCPLVAMMHGLYPIERDPTGTREYITRSNRVPLEKAADVSQPLREDGGAEPQRRTQLAGQAMSPAQFIQQIRSAVNPENSKLREHPTAP